MCGIVAYTGDRSAVPILLNGLRRLEYRGYDSAGIAVEVDGEIKVRKSEGKVAVLSDLIAEEEELLSGSTCGIAHTRWATHGPPTTVNAHPHGSEKNGVVLVHNGIIENHRNLRERLKGEGYEFASKTDTEVLVHLVDYYYKGDLADALANALKEVEGTFGVACLAKLEPGVLVVARRGSPIVIGLNGTETVVASDASAIITHTRQAVYLDDNDIAKIKDGNVDIRSLDAMPVSRPTAEIDWSDSATEKGGYEHYMLKEIFEQPESVRNTIRGRMDTDRGNAMLSGLNLTPRDLADLHRLLIVGCGTSMNAGMVGE